MAGKLFTGRHTGGSESFHSSHVVEAARDEYRYRAGRSKAAWPREDTRRGVIKRALPRKKIFPSTRFLFFFFLFLSFLVVAQPG